MRRKPLSLLLACYLLTPCLADEQSDRQRLQTLQKEIGALHQQVASAQTAREQQLTALETSERALADLRKKILTLDQSLRQQIEALAALETREGALEQARHLQATQIRKEVAAAYRLGQEEPVKLFLNQDDPERISRQLRYYRYVVEARASRLDQYRATLTELEQVKMQLLATREALTDTRENYRSEQASLALAQQNRQQALSALELQLGSDQQKLAALDSERRQLEQVIAALEKAIRELNSAASQPFAKRKGKLLRPASGKVLRTFGARRAANLNWLGWLMQTREGDPVVAIHSGRVVFSDYLRGQGLLLIIDHGDGYLSLYAHNQNLLKDTGDWVQGGEMVARAGISGGLEQSALYFEIRHNGKPLDPGAWLARASK